jgi:hypothetical protein
MTVTQPIMQDNDLNAVIVDPNDLTKRIAEWKAAGFHVLSPAIKFTSFAKHFGANVGAIVISTDPAAGECYLDKGLMKEDERAIGRIGLDRIAQLAGISWLPASRRTDSRTIQRLWEYVAFGAYVSYDGTPQIISDTAEVDLRDGSDQIGGWTPDGWKALVAKNATLPNDQRVWNIGGWSEARVSQARRFGLRLCETKAKSAAIRTIGLKAKYTVAELQRPFIILRFQYLPDMEDATVRQMVAEHSMRGVSSLYANSMPRELAESTGADVIDITTVRRPEPVVARGTLPVAPSPAAPAAEPIQPASVPTSTVSSAPPAASPAAPSAPVSQPAQTGLSPANFIKNVTREPKTYGPNHARKGQTFIKFHVIDGNGVEHVTIMTKFGELAETHWKAQTPVTLVSSPNGFREQQIVNIEPFNAAAPVTTASEIKL